MANARPQLQIDEDLLFAALEFLNGRPGRYELLNVVKDFTREPQVEDRFLTDVGVPMTEAERNAIEHYVNGITLVSHHRANITYVREVIRETDPVIMDFVRLAGWALLTAWSQLASGTVARV